MLTRFLQLGLRTRGLIFPHAAATLPAMLTTVGYEHRADPRAYDWHGLKRGSSRFALLQHTLAGRGRLRFENRSFVVEPGQTMLLTFPHDNRYWLAEGESWTFFFLCLSGPEVLRAFGHAIQTRGPLTQLSTITVDTAADACLAALHDDALTPGQASSLAYAVAMALLDETSPRPPEEREATRRDPAVAQAVAYAQAHLDEELDVDVLAGVTGFSRWHFTRRFAASEGVSPAAFIQKLRMKEAVRLLQSTDLPVKAVARQCGFADPNYFGKAFRRAFGVAPGEFRQSGMYGGAQ